MGTLSQERAIRHSKPFPEDFVKRTQFLQLLGVFTVGFALAATAGVADAKVGSANNASVKFTAIGPGGLAFHGTSSDLKVEENAGAIKIIVRPETLDTNMTLRNDHMKRKYLHVAEHPTASLTVQRSELKIPGSGTVRGKFHLHGVEVPADVKYTVTGAGKLHVVGDTTINLENHRIEVPRYLGQGVKPDVQLHVEFDTTDG